MPRQSLVFEVVIASPSDVVSERKLLTEVIEDEIQQIQEVQLPP